MPSDKPSNLDANQPSRASYDAVVAEFERDMIRQVDQEMRGQDPHLVHSVLAERIRGRLPGVELDDLDLRTIARAISKGTLRDWVSKTR